MALKELGMSGVSFDLFRTANGDDEEKQEDDDTKSNQTNTSKIEPVGTVSENDNEMSNAMNEKLRRLKAIMQKGGIEPVEGADDVLRSIAESKSLAEIPDPDAVLLGSDDVGKDESSLPKSSSDTFNEWLDEKNAGGGTLRKVAPPRPGSDADLKYAAKAAGIGKGEIKIVRDASGDAGFSYDSKTLKITKVNDRGSNAGIAIGKKIRSVDGVDVRDSNHYKKLAKSKNEFVLRLG